MCDEKEHLTVTIGKLAALSCDLDQLTTDEIYWRIRSIIERLRRYGGYQEADETEG